MKILIVTQVVDKEHPILGFFHRWIEEFAKRCEQVHVICLQEGKHSLPANVTVHSLGKESGKGRLTYLLRFYTYIWKYRKEYDSVFVHMNQVYVILGAPLWRLSGKKIKLWYMHGSVPFTLRIAEKLAHKIFTGSSESFRIKSEKVIVTGHGIDTARFAPQAVPKTIDLITVGRITPSKNLITLIETIAGLQEKKRVSLVIVGSAVTEDELRYEKQLHDKVRKLHLEDVITFKGKVTQSELPTILSGAKVFVTVAQNGSLDKAVLEAMSCGLPVVSMAPGTSSLPLSVAQTSTKEEFLEQLERVISSISIVPDYVTYIKETHSLQKLIPKILK
ncbi:MAG: hypothetical protein RL538_314 [Candidatus Parcubacteria bacterium]|jgi:glycosyltransferase involved in cell wall biosynthesis